MSNTRRTSLADHAEHLHQDARIPFVKAADLADGPTIFDLVGYAQRMNRNFGDPRPECVFTIETQDGERALLTLMETPIRKRVGQLVNRTRRIGPLALVNASDDGSTLWAFADVTADGEIQMVAPPSATDPANAPDTPDVA